MERLADIFRAHRISEGLSQAQAAEAAGVSVRTVKSFEAGALGISLGNVRRLLFVVRLELIAREASLRPNLDELASRYAEDDTPAIQRKRVSRKRKP